MIGILEDEFIYYNESILDWSSSNNKIDFVKLMEKSEGKVRYTVLRLLDGVYTKKVYDEDQNHLKTTRPLDIDGNTYGYIPFVVSRNSLHFCLEDIVKNNFSSDSKNLSTPKTQ